ncbi:MAG: KamA family radical SAM protein, partial [Planctomycetota bacterium]
MSCISPKTDRASRPSAGDQAAGWRAELARAVRDPAELCRLLGLPDSLAAAGTAASDQFPLFVPRPYLERIRPGDPRDPLLLQVMPREAERVARPGFSTDPVGEQSATRAPGLLWKYQNRLLIVTTGACGVHCRYCFRRHFPYRPTLDDWRAALEVIAAERSVHEVILSGGDPLRLPDDRLAELARRLAEIPHLRRIRLHTRLPVVVPQRVTDELIGWLRSTRLTPLVVIQVNHPAELDDSVAAALGRLVDAGVPVLNQSVLLRDVNDDIDILAELSERLVGIRV